MRIVTITQYEKLDSTLLNQKIGNFLSKNSIKPKMIK